MTNKFVTISKYLILGVGVLVGMLSCENDFENIGVDIVDNDVFTSEKYTSNVVAYSSNIERNQTNNLTTQLLGVFHHENFGKLEASVLSQLTKPAADPDYGVQAIIDTVILDIPFSKENLLLSGAGKINLKVNELETFLHRLNPENPTEIKKYYSDDSFDVATSLFEGEIAPTENDTLLIVNRYRYTDLMDLSTAEIVKKDTLDTEKPSLKIGLDETFFKTNFIDMAGGSEFASQANFTHHFKGLYIEALESIAGEGAFVSTDLAGANVTIYYNKVTIEDEASDEDLNGNEITGESGVSVQTPSKVTYSLVPNGSYGVKVNLYERDFTATDMETYLASPDMVNGDDKLYVHGAIGSDAVIKLFEDTELEELRTKEWLINDAQLTFYVDETNITDETALAIYIYTFDDGDKVQVFKADKNAMFATLEKDEDSPTKYTIHLTDYITEILDSSTELELKDFGIKVYEATDDITISPKEISEKSSNFRGVVLKGNNLLDTDDKVLKLEIFYSEKNN